MLIDETGLFLNPLVKRSWAKVGQTPVLEADGGHRLTLYHEGGEYMWDATPRPEPKK
ncbi:MAG: hypothetical protein KF873_21865 [Gemmataceae bacterium]|nr:hypothetical protein [Gemmataceae bacterium]